MIAGVCGGLGRYFNVNPVFYRVGFVVLTLLGGAGLLIYGACLLVIPNEGEQDSIASDVLRNHRQRPIALVGLALVAAAGIALLSHISLRIHSDTFWVLVLVGGGVLLWSQRRPAPRAAPADAAPGTAVVQPRRRGIVGIALAAVGLLVAAAVIAGIVFAGVYAHLGDGVGHRHYRPLTVSALRHDYKVGVGDLQLDLSQLTLPAGATTVRVHVGIGRLHVTVPSGVTVRAKAHVSWGEAVLLGHDEDGHNVRADVGPTGAQLVLATDVGIGQAEVTRSVR